MPSSPSSSRRNFLKTAGSLSIAIPLLGMYWPGALAETAAETLPGSLRRTPRINAWLEVLEDGRVRIFSGKVELGQGIRIAIKQVAAEELNLELAQVEIVLADTDRTPNEGYTAGSGSIQNSAMAVRYAAAAAREKLLQLAAEKWSLPKEKLLLGKGEIREAKGSRTISLADLLDGKQIEDEVQLPLLLKNKAEYRYVGQSISREDVPAMLTGKPVFVQDMRLPGMLYARVLRPRNYQSSLLQLDEAAFRAEAKGLEHLFRNGSFVGVVCKHQYQAEEAVRLLAKHSTWSEPAIFPDFRKLPTHFKKIAEAPKTVHEAGIIPNSSSETRLTARYFKPYHMHAAMGPACAVALLEEGILHVWTHSQGIYPLREALKSMLGLTSEQLHLISVPGAGCFGHTVADDAAADAALLAMSMPGRSIQVQWSRYDEQAWEPYGSAMVVELEAGLDKNGRINSWQAGIWTDSASTRPNREAGTVLAARYLDPPMPMKSRGYLAGGHRNADPYYDIPNQHVQAHFFEGPLRVSSLRSLGAYGNIFALESFMDELADQAGQDPVAFRLAHLSDPRAKAVLESVQVQTKGEPSQAGEGIGYAFCRYKNNAAYCAVAAKVGVDEKGKVRLRKLWAAVDVGEIINPDGLKNQIEGGLTQAASWTMKEAVQFDEKRITSLDLIRYPIFRMGDSPEVEVVLIDRPEEPAMGGGEASVPPTGAAIANAVFRATGQRVYELPIRL